MSLTLNGENDTQLPLTNPTDYKQVGNVLDLSNNSIQFSCFFFLQEYFDKFGFFFSDNSDLIACTIVFKDGQKSRRFMVIETIQIILVEPDQRLGWGIAKLVGNLQDLEVTTESYFILVKVRIFFNYIFFDRYQATRTILDVCTSPFINLHPLLVDQVVHHCYKRNLFSTITYVAWLLNNV